METILNECSALYMAVRPENEKMVASVLKDVERLLSVLYKEDKYLEMITLCDILSLRLHNAFVDVEHNDEVTDIPVACILLSLGEIAAESLKNEMELETACAASACAYTHYQILRIQDRTEKFLEKVEVLPYKRIGEIVGRKFGLKRMINALHIERSNTLKEPACSCPLPARLRTKDAKTEEDNKAACHATKLYSFYSHLTAIKLSKLQTEEAMKEDEECDFFDDCCNGEENSEEEWRKDKELEILRDRNEGTSDSEEEIIFCGECGGDDECVACEDIDYERGERKNSRRAERIQK